VLVACCRLYLDSGSTAHTLGSRDTAHTHTPACGHPWPVHSS